MIRFNSVSKSFEDGTIAVEAVDLNVAKGQFCVFLGPSGAGKSTLLRMVNGMITPTSGNVIFQGEPVNKKSLKFIQQRIGMIHQQLHLIPRLSVLNNVLSGVLPVYPTWKSLLYYFPQVYKRKACKLLRQVELEEKHLYRRVSSLSGGQQQRVAIAKAFMLEPDVVLADEPVASLDPVISRNVLRLLKIASQEHNSSVLCSLHQVELALEFADHIIGLRKGKVVFKGDPEDLTPDILDDIYDGEPGAIQTSMATESFKNLILRRTLLDPSIKVEVMVS